MKNLYFKLKQENSGITLISLVITIIVLLILATIGISSGISAINSSRLTKFTTQMKLMQLEVNELYEKYSSGKTVEMQDGTKYTGEDIATIGKDLSQANQEQINSIFKSEEQNGSGITDKTGYRFFDKTTIDALEIEEMDQEFLINVQTRTVISYEGLKYDNKMYYTLEQLPDSLYNVEYDNPNTGKPTFDVSYEQLENGKWRIIVSNIRYEDGQEGFVAKWEVKYQLSDTEEPDKWYTSDDLEFIVDAADEYRIVVFQQGVESEIKTIKISNASIPTTPVDEDTIYTDPESNNKEAFIPKGFKVSEVASEQKIDTGLVVIAPDGSEFVWVPVDKTTLCVDGVADKEVAEIASGTDYRGVLYNFSGTTSSKREYSDTGYREPAYLTDSTYGDANSEYNTIGLTPQTLQDEYNAIIDSIKTKGGFYIGRYESSLSGSTKDTMSTTGNIQSKRDIMPTSANNSGTYRWYGLYAKQKEYATVINSSYQTNVKSAMIYGSMYDAVMNWALYGADKTDADEITKSSTKHGPESTGALETDKIKNIYDLGNNLYEWTAEAHDTGNRVDRGR